jgi:hypothetical protein
MIGVFYLYSTNVKNCLRSQSIHIDSRWDCPFEEWSRGSSIRGSPDALRSLPVPHAQQELFWIRNPFILTPAGIARPGEMSRGSTIKGIPSFLGIGGYMNNAALNNSVHFISFHSSPYHQHQLPHLPTMTGDRNSSRPSSIRSKAQESVGYADNGKELVKGFRRSSAPPGSVGHPLRRCFPAH